MYIDRLYWVFNVVFSWTRVNVEFKLSREICFDECPPSKGWARPEDHFLAMSVSSITCITEAMPILLRRSTDS